ncbi:unnamed protein product [Medioppia subpectinata]|uniref:Uncharacterized protein n=1 Tax=Medioppia subpectinata TaxID=1979941 RepID=A0A7R9KX41_9ACAR|nr:unnamed protein product [Medioppia subpectinata]CAG2110389.1 unnamed protein product [Medioppia subpectinata]
MSSRAYSQCVYGVVVVIAMIIAYNVVSCGESCRRKDVNGNDDVFECPRLFESNKKRFCCGFTAQDKHCCEWSKKSKDLVVNPGDVKYLFEGAVAVIIVALLVVGGLIVCCCVCACCLLSRKRQSRGHVLGKYLDFHPNLSVTSCHTEGGTSVTTIPSYPNSASYPVQNAPSYPLQPYPPDQPPPPYNYSQTQPAYNPSYPTYNQIKPN